MTVRRLRPLPSPDELAAMYPAPHDHFLYGRGHGERVDETIRLACEAIPWVDRCSIGDLSCGNAHIARSIVGLPTAELHLGDFAPAFGSVGLSLNVEKLVFGHTYSGPIEETIHAMPEVGTFVCSETIEHLDDPGGVLALIRSKASRLVLSTPLDCWDDTNGEHLWAWDREGVEDLMLRAGWTPEAFTSVDSRGYGEPYLYGIWVAR